MIRRPWFAGVLALALQSPPPRIDPPPKPESRTPVPTARQQLEDELARLPLADLLRRQPEYPWDRTEEKDRLLPAVAELVHRAESGTWTDEEWRTALTVTDMIHTRPRWPAGVPLQVCIGSQAWLRVSMISVRAIEPDLGEVSFDNRHPSRCGNCAEADRERARHLKLAALPPGTSRVVFVVTVMQRTDPDEIWSSSKASRLLWKGRLERLIEAVPVPEDVMPASDTQVERDIIRESLRAFWSNAPAYPNDFVVSLRGTYGQEPALRGLGISLKVEFWEATRKVRACDLVVSSRRSWIGSTGEWSGWLQISGLAQLPREPDADLSEWELRVRGDPSSAAGIWEAERWWNGSFTMPLAEAIEHGKN